MPWILYEQRDFLGQFTLGTKAILSMHVFFLDVHHMKYLSFPKSFIMLSQIHVTFLFIVTELTWY